MYSVHKPCNHGVLGSLGVCTDSGCCTTIYGRLHNGTHVTEHRVRAATSCSTARHQADSRVRPSLACTPAGTPQRRPTRAPNSLHYCCTIRSINVLSQFSCCCSPSHTLACARLCGHRSWLAPKRREPYLPRKHVLCRGHCQTLQLPVVATQQCNASYRSNKPPAPQHVSLEGGCCCFAGNFVAIHVAQQGGVQCLFSLERLRQCWRGRCARLPPRCHHTQSYRVVCHAAAVKHFFQLLQLLDDANLCGFNS